MPTLYFDLGSPYAYLACERAALLGPELEWEPVLLGAIFKLRGFGSWSATPARVGRIAELEARARRYGLPALRAPAGWPSDGLEAMRCATWAKAEGRVEPFARAAFRAQFVRGESLAGAGVLEACAGEADLEGERMLREVEGPAVKQALRQGTQAAWEAGVRGVPSVRVGDSIFFGDDQLELASAALGEVPTGPR